MANLSASSPRAAFSRARKSSVEGSAEASWISVWAFEKETEYQYMASWQVSGGHQCCSSSSLPPESKSSRDGKRSAILCVSAMMIPDGAGGSCLVELKLAMGASRGYALGVNGKVSVPAL